jgi:hypothetical protein
MNRGVSPMRSLDEFPALGDHLAPALTSAASNFGAASFGVVTGLDIGGSFRG